MKTILISAYALSPTKGSEFNVGWEFVTRLSVMNRVIVLYGVSGSHIGETAEIDEHFKLNPSKNIIPIKVNTTLTTEFFNFFNKKGLNYAFYIAFNFWQRQAYRQAVKLVNLYDVDIIHQLNPIGFREPGYLWKINKPFVWGPVGGANFVEQSLLVSQPLKTKIIFSIKNVITYFQMKLSIRVRKALAHADLVVFCNNENKQNLNNHNIKESVIISEQACSFVDLASVSGSDNKEVINSKLELVIVGSLFHRKNLKFLIDVISFLKDDVQLCLNIVGDGHLKEELLKYSKIKKVDNLIAWHGHQSRDNVLKIMKKSDLHCLCSLSEANTTVVYEAFSVGLPTISLNQNGMMDTLSDGMGFLVDINDYTLTVNSYANKISEIYYNRSLLLKCSERINENIDTLGWDAKIEIFNDYYDEILKSKH